MNQEKLSEQCKNTLSGHVMRIYLKRLKSLAKKDTFLKKIIGAASNHSTLKGHEINSV